MKIKTISILSTLGLGLLSQSLLAGNITAINVGTLQNQQRLIKIQFDRDPTLPRGFTTENPARIALDFDDTGLTVPQNLLKFNDSVLQQIEAGQTSARTRVLLSLAKAGQYNATIKDNEVWIYVQGSLPEKIKGKGKQVPLVNATPVLNSPSYPASNNITEQVISHQTVSADNNISNATVPVSVDFQKGKNGSGVVSIIGLNGKVQPVIKRNPSSLTLTYKNLPLLTELQRNLDVTDFSTPVRSIRLRRLGNDTEVNIQMQGNWEYNQIKSGNNLIVEVSRKFDLDSEGLKNTNKSFKGKRVSLDFQDIDVRTILQILAKESGMNIVASDSVQGKMTISLKDVPWDQALNLVMESRNLDMRRNGNVINVAPREELLSRDTATLEQQKKIDDLGPLLSQTFQLKYRSVEDFRKILKLSEDGKSSDPEHSILSPRGSALMDSATNNLIITDISSVIKKFEKLIAQVDVPSQQVLIEARIVETTDSFARELGTKFGYNRHTGRNIIGGHITENNWSNAGGGSGSATFDSPNINLGVTNPTSIVSWVHNFASGALFLELSASQSEGKTKIISSPRVLTQDRKEAKIESGYEVPYQEATSSGATSVSFKDAVLGLKVTPQITPDGNIIMTLNVQNDHPVACSNVAADVTRSGDICLQKRTVNTQTMIENGGTLIIGGIYNENNEYGTSKVPLLGDIPGIGNLFKYKKNKQDRSEVLVFITPRIVESTNTPLKY
ncbi:pilus assembly protein PilQ [Snodgrassella alvi]|jgi:type IV pilus assembly protein PilQ|uniref:Pilus assembly protein PilQ n=1 Tax=Snodgrassella alvi TaxID=1196083 RepID=A0A2N9XCI7_9NEIS|nr:MULTISPECIES: type IV pilus secretin PilQ [Snodgrassella]PIT20625.1 pilus assembly protein PilQ [Snodgrassella communis]PIT44360.1 pilus assembly protein PilQ [Snodgrassella alvi]